MEEVADQKEQVIRRHKIPKLPTRVTSTSTFGIRKGSSPMSNTPRKDAGGHRSARSIAFMPTACPRCIEKDAVFIEVRGSIRKATDKLRPFKAASFAFHEQEHAREF